MTTPLVLGIILMNIMGNILHHYGVDIIVHSIDYKGSMCTVWVLISSFTPYRFKGVATTPLVLGYK